MHGWKEEGAEMGVAGGKRGWFSRTLELEKIRTISILLIILFLELRLY